MLGDHPITPVLLAKDLAATREFYHDRLGLEILTENDDAIVFKCGGGTHLDVTKSTVGTADEQTQVSWQVPDLRAEVAELRSRGVQVEEYDLPGLKTEDGIADPRLRLDGLDHRPRQERPLHHAAQGLVAAPNRQGQGAGRGGRKAGAGPRSSTALR
jgi:catechol 2,3-dioxygenase-like lactoylglutathione lyase family enzyme